MKSLALKFVALFLALVVWVVVSAPRRERVYERRFAAPLSIVGMPREFVIPGETRASAALELARAVLRRAERRIVSLTSVEPIGEWLLAYVNRLADLLWVLARVAEQAEHVAPTKLHG